MSAGPSLKRLRVAIVLLMIGIGIQLGAFIYPHPPMFVLFGAVAVPCMVTGMALYASYVWKQLRKKDVL